MDTVSQHMDLDAARVTDVPLPVPLPVEERIARAGEDRRDPRAAEQVVD
jgi:hypothetical protein